MSTVLKTSTEETKQLLKDRLSEALKHLLPKGVFQHNKFYVGDVHGNKGRSLVVEIASIKAGLWHDFATNTGGDILDLA